MQTPSKAIGGLVLATWFLCATSAHGGENDGAFSVLRYLSQRAGIGKTRTNTGAGLQTFPFEVVQGSDQVGAGHFFGFYTGDPAGKPNAGVAEYNDDYQDRMIILTLDGGLDNQKVTLGQSYRENSRWPRAYSAQAVSKRK